MWHACACRAGWRTSICLLWLEPHPAQSCILRCLEIRQNVSSFGAHQVQLIEPTFELPRNEPHSPANKQSVTQHVPGRTADHIYSCIRPRRHFHSFSSSCHRLPATAKNEKVGKDTLRARITQDILVSGPLGMVIHCKRCIYKFSSSSTLCTFQLWRLAYVMI